MRSPTAAVALAALLVIAAAGATAALPSAPAPSAADPSGATVQESTANAAADVGRSTTAVRTQPDPAEPRQVIRVAITAGGDAVWTVESRYRLESADDREAFEAFAADVAAGERDVGYDAATFERFAATAADATDREMAIVDAGWDDPVVRDENGTALADGALENGTVGTGVVAYRFTWTNFARTDGSRIHLGDVFRTDGGTWLESLTDGQRLVIEPPENYGYEQLPRTPEDGALVWDGPHEFEPDELAVTYLQGATPPGNDTEGSGSAAGGESGDPGGSSGGDGGDESPLPSAATALGVLVLLVAVGAAGYYLARRETATEDGAATAASADASEPSAAPAAESTPDAGDGSDADAGADDVVSTYDEGRLEDAADATDDETEPEEEDEIDVELLSDEERVHRLLRGNDGRMKQVSIVKETGWSNAKVSQLLSEMDENGEIEKLRIGRENLITLPEVDPTEID